MCIFVTFLPHKYKILYLNLKRKDIFQIYTLKWPNLGKIIQDIKNIKNQETDRTHNARKSHGFKFIKI